MAKINDTTVIFNNAPASFGVDRWFDASVTGNGVVRASVLGAYSNEEILIGRADLKHGGYTGVLQDVSDKFPSVRKLYTDGKIMDAEKLLPAEFAKKGYKPSVEQSLPLAVIGLDFSFDGLVSGYRRTIDMASGEVEVSFKHGSTSLTRGLFVGRNNDIMAYNVSKNGPDKVNLRLSLKSPEGINPQNILIKYEGGFAYFAARLPSGQDYGLVARIVTSTGVAEHGEDGIRLKNNDGFALLIKTFIDSNRDTEFRAIKSELMGVRNSYDKLLSQHENAHGKLFNACTLQLGDGKYVQDDFATLLSRAGSIDLDSGLAERLWNFGKYLYICGYGADYMSFNNSAQLIYCGAMSGVIPNMALSFFSYFEKYIDDLKKNAARVFGMRGYFVPCVSSPKSALFGEVDPETLHFVASSALAANLFYTYYLITADAKVLKSRILPFMREVAVFYSDFLKLDQNGFYTTIPSYSPLSTPGNTIAGRPLKDFAFATNSTIDFLAISCLLDNLIDASNICGTNQADIPTWQDMKTKIPTLSVNENGCIREYTNSAFIDGAMNCGTMHAYGLWPLKNISFNDESVSYKPAVAQGQQLALISLRRAAFNAVMTRLSNSGMLQNAQTLCVCAAQVAHAGLGESSAIHARNILLKLVNSCITSSGLCLTNDWRGSGFTRHGDVALDISGNIGFANAMTECIVQSGRKNLRLLPSIFEGLQSGRLNDVSTDFGAKVSLDWDTAKRRLIVKIVPKVNCKIDVEVCDTFRRVKNKDLKMDSDINGIRDLQLTAGRTLTLEFM